MSAAGFEDVRTSVEQSPVVFPDAVSYRTFITNVICRPYLAYLPDAPSRDAFIDELTRQAASDDPRFELTTGG